MLVDKIIFFIMTIIFISVNLFDKFKECYKKSRNKTSLTNVIQPEATVTSKTKKRFNMLKFVLNSYASFNSVVVCIGYITETYLYGGRVLLNGLSISIGFLVAFFILHPVIYNLESIKSPYEYLQYRYGNKRSIRVITAFFGNLFYLLFMALHLWGCSIILSSILPEIPQLYVSSIAIGIYGIIGSIFKGFNQSVTVNLIQFILLISGLMSAIIISFNSNKNNKSPTELWEIAELYNRRNFINTNVDLTTRYTIWNQIFALPIPWCTMHIIIQPRFTKYRSIKGKQKSRIILLLHLPLMLLVTSLFVFSGIATFVFYYDSIF